MKSLYVGKFIYVFQRVTDKSNVKGPVVVPSGMVGAISPIDFRFVALTTFLFLTLPGSLTLTFTIPNAEIALINI